MSTACLLVGTAVLTLASQDFELRWRHSVERIEWRESWAVDGGRLHLTEAAVKGSGAGMEPGEGARLMKGWWVWRPDLAPVSVLTLAASGATGQGWRLCDAVTCREIGAEPGAPIALRPCGGADVEP
ncbi:DUF1850 domain-containing protein [Frigidibacter sp. RF13]|uniref:DUF1850 domain-containing protein n=1 Tax=Frigidibacter sp. RF13 TaxID=2997340 RepID=UPI002270C748|nr:DUF1850 domain-containing protein [Frigidibacter sp. RF13]MCY1128007.1 DUF1850 domain-containing protein [Frigidibacter sp. RF13]